MKKEIENIVIVKKPLEVTKTTPVIVKT